MKATPRGRPRNFDRTEALQSAMMIFWSTGYEGASMSDLTKAMGINAPSLYAAFGSKENLFREAVDHYRATIGSGTSRALREQPTARAAVESILKDAVAMFTAAETPPGCLLVVGAMNCSSASRTLQLDLKNLLLGTQKLIRQRIERGIAEGDVPPQANAEALSQFYVTVLHGLSIQSRDGVSQDALQSVVACALSAWDGLTQSQAKTTVAVGRKGKGR